MSCKFPHVVKANCSGPVFATCWIPRAMGTCQVKITLLFFAMKRTLNNSSKHKHHQLVSIDIYCTSHRTRKYSTPQQNYYSYLFYKFLYRSIIKIPGTMAAAAPDGNLIQHLLTANMPLPNLKSPIDDGFYS